MKHLTELMNRYGVQGTSSVPVLKVEDPELEQLTPESVKDAQRITRAVLWATTRSRPDLMFITGRMGQWATKAPRKVKEWGLQALRYAAGTLQLGLEFRCDPGHCWAKGTSLQCRGTPIFGGYSDASHAPNGGRSVQSTVLLWRGCIIL